MLHSETRDLFFLPPFFQPSNSESTVHNSSPFGKVHLSGQMSLLERVTLHCFPLSSASLPFCTVYSHRLVPPPQSIYTESLDWALFWGNLSKGTNSGNFRLFPGCGFSIWKVRSGKVSILSRMYSSIVLVKRPYMCTLRPNSSLYHCVILLVTYCLTVALSHR